jgi:hypothetical protein
MILFAGQYTSHLLRVHWNQLHRTMGVSFQAGYNYCRSQERLSMELLRAVALAYLGVSDL